MGGGTEPTIVADAHKALRQDVEKPAADKFVRSEGFTFDGVVRTVAVTQDDASGRIETFEMILMECGLFDIGGEVAQSGASASGALTLGDPVGGPDDGGDTGKDGGMVVGEKRTQGVTGGAGERLMRDLIVFEAGMMQRAAALTKSHGMNKGMDMRMKPAR